MPFGLMLAALVFCSVQVSAQAADTPAGGTGRVSGLILESRTSVPLAAVLVQVQSTRQRAYSDEEGRFTIDSVPAGTQTLVVSVVGFGLVRREVTVVEGQMSDVTIRVAEGASTYVEDVVVAGSPFREAEAGAASQAVLGSRELLALRGLIADDPFRAVQVLPGVAATDDYTAEFSVRGLGPYHVGLAIDGVDSPLLFHTVRAVDDTGSLALINSDILEEATLLSGAHPQVLGSHLGARLDFRTRDGARDRVHGRVLVSGSATTTVWEGPLGGGDRGSWLLAGRKSYLDWLLRRVDTSLEGTFGFTDGQAKLTLNPVSSQTLRLSVIAGRSLLDEDPEGTLNGFDRGSSRTVIGNLQWRLEASPKVAVTQQIYVVDGRYVNRVEDGRPREEGGDHDLTWRGGVEWTPSARHFFQAGGQVQALSSDRINRFFTSSTGSVTTSELHPSTSTRAAWLSYRWMPSASVVISPGARVEHWRLLHHTAASPWLLTEWQLAPKTRLRGGIGVQRQAVDAVAGPLLRPGDTIVPERARVIDVGLDHRMGSSWRASAILYHRDEADRLRLVDSEFHVVNGRVARPGSPYLDNVLDGTSKGIELTLERRTVNGLNGWISYAWSKSQVTDVTTGETYFADFDQRHTVNMNVAYRWSDRSSLGLRYRYGSNFPLQGYLEPRGDTHFLSSERNAGRLPVYARLDLRADRSFTFRKSRLTLFVEVINALNRDNFRTQSSALDVRTGEVFNLTEKLFPLLPSAGILIEF